MLKNIKSIYFRKILFFFVDEERKLNIIKYNKSLQKLLDINLINYKMFKGKYIIYESKTKAKEYKVYYDDLVFEGEYLNGKNKW